jgi:hypothetical protein
MYAINGLFERWGALVIGIVLVGLPVGGWIFARPFNPVDIIVGGVGIGALLVAVDDFLRRRELARLNAEAASPSHLSACPHCGHSLPEGA